MAGYFRAGRGAAPVSCLPLGRSCELLSAKRKRARKAGALQARRYDGLPLAGDQLKALAGLPGTGGGEPSGTSVWTTCPVASVNFVRSP